MDCIRMQVLQRWSWMATLNWSRFGPQILFVLVLKSIDTCPPKWFFVSQGWVGCHRGLVVPKRTTKRGYRRLVIPKRSMQRGNVPNSLFIDTYLLPDSFLDSESFLPPILFIIVTKIVVVVDFVSPKNISSPTKFPSPK